MPRNIAQKYNTADNEYLILAEIAADSALNQRKLAKRLGLSLGTINTLLSKLVREGQIRVEQVSGRQVVYLLTAQGASRKAEKAVGYLKAHYRALSDSSQKIKATLERLARQCDCVVVLRHDDELGAIVDGIIAELKQSGSNFNLVSIDDLNNLKDVGGASSVALFNATVDTISREQLTTARTVINITEQL